MSVYQRYGILFLIGAVLFLPFLGAVHLFDWDEINFAECAREMLVSKDYLRMQIDYQPFWEKPPLFIWLQALSMGIFGVGEYAARFPNALVGIATLIALYHIGRKIADERRSLLWVGFYLASWLPHFYFKTGIIDPLFNLLIVAAMYQLYRLRTAGSSWLHHAGWGGLFLGLAVLTKGPVALIVSGITFLVYLLANRGLSGYRIGRLLVFAGVTLLVAASWFAVEVMNHGWWFVREFINYQVGLFFQNIADHEEPWYYHPIVLLIGCFPASLLMIPTRSVAAHRQEGAQRDFKRLMWILFWVVLILFSIVKTKIVHYSSLCYFPITYLAAIQAEAFLEGRKRLHSAIKAGLLVIGTVWALILIALPVAGLHKERLIPYIADPFAVGNLQAAVPWSYAECIWGVLYLIGIWVGIWWLRSKPARGVLVLFAVQIVAIQVTLLHFTPKIEAYSQRAAIEFFQSKANEDCYVGVIGYKSYAHLFYTRKQPPVRKEALKDDWLRNGPVDKPTYFVGKVDSKEAFINDPNLEVISEKNGFVFLKRKNVNTNP
ncbi:MAG: glycosyltransferase family 39 protein [Sphingobacteriales bacterium]|nr:MAG: glycosyltransferase family 39 protein [Sphingobacteriales bacterium]